MNTNELLASWSALSIEEIESRLEAGADQDAAEQLFGAQEMTDMQELIKQPRPRGLREAVVLLPGFMGSLLTSIRGLTTFLWINPAIFLNGQSSHLELNPTGTGDRDPEIESVPFSLEKVTYLKISIALRRQVELFEFPYDWRRPIEQSGDLLHECLERWAGGGDPGKRFTLVGHSMGGIVARAYLARHGQAAEKRIKRVIMHGTPHLGAASAVENIAVGNRNLEIMQALNANNAPRRLLLNMPSVYQLLPAPPELFPSGQAYPANWDLYAAADWRMDGIRQDYLDAGRRFHELLAKAGPQVDVVQIAGCHLDTVVAVQRSFTPDGKSQYELTRVGQGPDGGDGTVPLWSAILPGARMYYIQEVHRDLVKNDQVIQATLDLIHGGAPQLPTQLPPPKTGWFGRDVVPPPELEAKRLRSRLEQGTASQQDLSLLYLGL
jgi:pimeloyl-ACP methyl ester carboxylesterase